MKYIIEICNRRKERVKRASIQILAGGCVISSFTEDFSWHEEFDEIAETMLAQHASAWRSLNLLTK